MQKFIIIVAFLILLLNCSSVPLNIKADLTKYPVKGKAERISSEACGFQLLLFIPIGVNDRQVRAFTYLVYQSSGKALDDIKMEESWTYGLVGTQYCTKFTANVYQ